MNAVVTLALKDLKLLVRDRIALFWALAFPLVFALFFGAVTGGSRDGRGKMSLVVVDEAGTEDSRKLVERLTESDALKVDTAVDADSASDLVRKGKRVAYLRIKPSFSGGPFALFGGGGDEAALELGVDPSRQAEQGMLTGIVSQSLFSDFGTMMSDPKVMAGQVADARRQIEGSTDLDPEQRDALLGFMEALGDFSSRAEASDLAPAGGAALTDAMIETKEVGAEVSGPRSAFEVTFPSAIVWGLIGCATTFAASLVRERTMGTLLRLRVAPITRLQLLLSKGLACFVAGLASSVVLLSIGVLALGVRIGNPLLLLLALPCAAACFSGIMLLLSVSGKTEAAVAGGSWVVIMPLAMIGGGMIPLIAMPQWMLTASNISPFKWAILAIEGAVWRDFGLSEIALPLAILVVLGVGFFALGMTIFSRGND